MNGGNITEDEQSFGEQTQPAAANEGETTTAIPPNDNNKTMDDLLGDETDRSTTANNNMVNMEHVG
eukprot:CAMPEP_0185731608 /NCGR_PEP_ID=MMETSP1171-20130828/13473_1 /TAXON_ID=374046 /ORGANISM="Helicotheca tamensis, Strain CCMP826" /LENGTH=65 /DNA_ID=CAMNT_0028400911 /DNA_START=105 /DNA_END=299 /DNA_ORIENTATION=-